MGENLFLDKMAIGNLAIDLQEAHHLQANAVSMRTVLRQLLAAQGLTFIVKDESIQVTDVQKARDMLVTRVYYLGESCRASGRSAGPAVGHVPRLPADDGQRGHHHQDDHQVDRPALLEGGRRSGPSITFHYPSMSIDLVRASPRFTPAS